MFLFATVLFSLLRSFPRMRGDVPHMSSSRSTGRLFSPHARGCSYYESMRKKNTPVFPACAGMFPSLTLTSIRLACFPRMRGDVPTFIFAVEGHLEFSPHARGCSAMASSAAMGARVFPACAGMFLSFSLAPRLAMCFPRMRGDVPKTEVSKAYMLLFSPHARGCSGVAGVSFPRRTVFPACAGMFLAKQNLYELVDGFPRMRGDVPKSHFLTFFLLGFSPHARGCSATQPAKRENDHVFPACAGMFRRWLPTT